MQSSNDLNPGLNRVENDTHIEVNYASRYALFDEKEQVSKPVVTNKKMSTVKKVPQLGVMLVGLGGNNGSTFVAGMLANKGGMSWNTKNGMQKANFFGSFTQSATTHVGFKHDEKTGELKDCFKPIKNLLPMVDPVNFDVCGWDISAQNLYEAANRAHVLEPSLIEQLKPDLEAMVPMKAVLNPDFIASNQADRADNVRLGTN
jgi:myo-inositol-1-phosphate synthase